MSCKLDREMSIPSGPILTPASWSGEELQHFPGWIHVLGAEERRELARAIESMRERRLPLAEVVPGVVTMPSVAASIAAWRAELQHGRGFVLVRGLPVEGYAPEDAARVYWLMGRCLGEPVPQNSAGDLLCDIRDTGADPDDPRIRLYQTRAEQDFHTDAADIIGLLCLRTARKGGISRIVSSVRVFNQLLAEVPELVPLLFEDWYFDLVGQQTAGMPPYFKMPIVRWDGKNLMSFFIGWYIRRAQAIVGVPELSPARRQLLEQYERTANDPRLFLDMEFRPGDVQWLKNSVILHKRTAYEDHEDPAMKRHLLRLWLTAKDFEDGDPLLRMGIDPEKARPLLR
jgi:hypothetical protein